MKRHVLLATLGVLTAVAAAGLVWRAPPPCGSLQSAMTWAGAHRFDRLRSALEDAHRRECPAEHRRCECRLVNYTGDIEGL